MARNEEWAKLWNEHVNDLCRLAWIPNNEDSKKVLSIVAELKDIIERNTEQKNKEVAK